jgi:hypothetical protein
MPFTSMLVVKQDVMPLTIETILKHIQNDQPTIMFDFRGNFTESILRNSSGELAVFGKALDKTQAIYFDSSQDTKKRVPHTTWLKIKCRGISSQHGKSMQRPHENHQIYTSF